MADTNALVALEDVVTRYLLKYKKSTEDYTIYAEHAANCIRDFQVYDGVKYRSEKVTVSALGIIEMPTDLITLGGISVARNGEWWSFTERPKMVNTTTTTDDVEGHDSDFGEGETLKDNKTYTYGAKGAVNAYYYAVDWDARRIFCDGIVSDTVLLKYVSSGIDTSEDTYIPEMLTPVVDNYLLWKETYWIPALVRERPLREKDYNNERLKVRNVLRAMTADQWRDILWGSFTQVPKR